MSKWGIEEKETIEAINRIGFAGNILNIAAGDGRFNNRLLELSQKVVAIDIDESELKCLKVNCPKKYANKLCTKVVDITQELPFQEATFDGIFCTGTLHLFDSETIIKIFQEIKRVLKVNGKIILDFATDVKRLDKNKKRVVFDGEGSFTTEEAISLFKEQFQDFSLNIEIASFREDNLSDDTGYNYISGNFLVISGIAREKNSIKQKTRLY